MHLFSLRVLALTAQRECQVVHARQCVRILVGSIKAQLLE